MSRRTTKQRRAAKHRKAVEQGMRAEYGLWWLLTATVRAKRLRMSTLVGQCWSESMICDALVQRSGTGTARIMEGRRELIPNFNLQGFVACLREVYGS